MKVFTFFYFSFFPFFCGLFWPSWIWIRIQQLWYGNIVLVQAGEWNQLNEKIIELTKKRSQLKMAVAKMVAECCTFLDQ